MMGNNHKSLCMTSSDVFFSAVLFRFAWLIAFQGLGTLQAAFCFCFFAGLWFRTGFRSHWNKRCCIAWWLFTIYFAAAVSRWLDIHPQSSNQDVDIWSLWSSSSMFFFCFVFVLLVSLAARGDWTINVKLFSHIPVFFFFCCFQKVHMFFVQEVQFEAHVCRFSKYIYSVSRVFSFEKKKKVYVHSGK